MSDTAFDFKNEKTNTEKRRSGLKEKLGQPQFVLDQVAEYIKEEDVASIADLIAFYISNSPKYKKQEQFVIAIGTARQTLNGIRVLWPRTLKGVSLSSDYSHTYIKCCFL